MIDRSFMHSWSSPIEQEEDFEEFADSQQAMQKLGNHNSW